jgi:hypothetical protein
MITKHVKLPEIVIESEGKIGEDTNTLPVAVFNQILDTIPRKYLDLDVWIECDIGPVIKKKRDGKGIGIDDKSNPRNQTDRDEMPIIRRKVPLFWGRMSRTFWIGKRRTSSRFGHENLFGLSKLFY